jgi:hypothetical protein
LLPINGVKTEVASLPISVLRSFLVLAGAVFFSAPAHANMVKQIMVGRCSGAMQDDFNKAAKTPPAGMVEETCGCIADGYGKGQSMDMVKAICVKQSTAKYNP